MSENENVQTRTPEPPVTLDEVVTSLLDEARDAGSGNAAVTLTPGRGGPMKQTVVAVRAGASLAPGHWNGPGSIQILRGTARLTGMEGDLRSGTWAPVPTDTTQVEAVEDLVALLTITPDRADEAGTS